MKRNLSLLVLILAVVAASSSASATIHVFTCEPEWGSLARELGGERVEVYAALTAQQDPHYARAKPSLVAAVRRANLIVCSGAGLEDGWLPLLVRKGGSTAVQPGNAGYLLASDVVPLLERPTSLDRAEGDVHPEGNPHLHLNPHNVLLVAAELTKRLKTIDAPGAAYYDARGEEFAARWNGAVERWEREAVPLRGLRVVVHHTSYAYLIDWLGLELAGTLEPKPGMPPTTAHLESLLTTLRLRPAALILRTPYDPRDASDWLSVKSATPAVLLPFTVGGDGRSADLFELFDESLRLLSQPKSEGASVR